MNLLEHVLCEIDFFFFLSVVQNEGFDEESFRYLAKCIAFSFHMMIKVHYLEWFYFKSNI